MTHLERPAAATDADAGADAGECAGADGGGALASDTEHSTVAGPAWSLHFPVASTAISKSRPRSARRNLHSAADRRLAA